MPTVCGSLREALDSLKADHDFLTKGDVFSKDFIESYIDLKYQDVYRFEIGAAPGRIRHVLLILTGEEPPEELGPSSQRRYQAH